MLLGKLLVLNENIILSKNSSFLFAERKSYRTIWLRQPCLIIRNLLKTVSTILNTLLQDTSKIKYLIA